MEAVRLGVYGAVCFAVIWVISRVGGWLQPTWPNVIATTLLVIAPLAWMASDYVDAVIRRRRR